MHRFHCAALAAVALVGFASVASAADMPMKAAPMVASVAAYNWTGFYVGGNAGWINATGDTNTDAAILSTGTGPVNGINLAASATNQMGNRSSGFIGGGQFGYNYQISPAWVAGIEADIQGSTLNGNANATLITDTGPFWQTTTTVSSRLNYFGTLRARGGFLATPALLLYGTGGLAYGGVNSSTTINFANTGGAVPGSTSGSFSSTRAGWTAGGGVEWMFVTNWSAKLEYLHYDLGSVTYATGGYAVDVGPTSFCCEGIVSVATSTTVHFKGDIVRLGLNYKFN